MPLTPSPTVTIPTTALDRARTQVMDLVAEHYEIEDEVRRSPFVQDRPDSATDDDDLNQWSGSWVSTTRDLDGSTHDRTITLVVIFASSSCAREDEYALNEANQFVGQLQDPDRLDARIQAIQVAVEQQALYQALDDLPTSSDSLSPARPRL